MSNYLRTIIVVLLLTLSLLVGSAWLFAEQLLDSVVRPQLEQLASRQLAANVKIARLVWTENGLRANDIEIDSAQLQLQLPRLELEFTLGGLWQRQLAALIIERPQLKMTLSATDTPRSESAALFPDQLPLKIASLRMIDGRLLVAADEQQWQFQELNFQGSLQPQSRFELTGRFGAQAEQSVAFSGRLDFAERRLTLDDVSWQDQQLLRRPFTLQLAGTGPELSQQGFYLQQFERQQLQQLLTALGKPALLPAQPDWGLADLRVAISIDPAEMTVKLQSKQGWLDWNNRQLAFTALRLQVTRAPAGWQVDGQLQGPAQTMLSFKARQAEQKRFTGTAQLEVPAPDRLQSELLGKPALNSRGGLHLTAEYLLEADRFEVTSELSGRPAETGGSDYLLQLEPLRGTFRLQSVDGREEFSANLQLDQEPLLTASGNRQQLKFSLIDGSLPKLKLLLNPERVPESLTGLSDLQVAGELSRTADDWTGQLTIAAAEVAFTELQLVELAGQAKLTAANSRLEIEAASLMAALTHGDELNLRLRAEAKGEVDAARFALDLQRLAVTQLNYLAADGLSGLGEGSVDLQGQLVGPWSGEPIKVTLHGEAKLQELLAGAFYAELADYPGNFRMQGEFSPSRSRLEVDSGLLQIAPLGDLTVSGQLAPDQLNLNTRLVLPDLATGFGEHVAPLLAGIRPTLAELTLEGEVAMVGQFDWTPTAWSTRGELQLAGLDAYWPRYQLEMVEGSGAIPFAARFGAPTREPEAAEQTGEISFSALSVGLASLEQGELQLAATDNHFRFRSPLRLQLADGRVAVSDLVAGWPEGKPQGSVKIDIRGVELEALTAELGLPVMQGRLSAELGTLHYAERQLRTAGVARIEVFGGRFLLQNMRFREPFSAYPTFFTDIDFSGLDLLQATRTFDFGEMNGVVDGYVHGLQLFGTTPVAFEAKLSSRPTGKRNISVKALNNLSIISQGGISAALSRGLYRFIDFYRYRQIGFECSLENDTFTLIGTARPDSERYLVYGGLLPPRIDITTTTPTISFKEMMNRISRIERAGS